MTPAWLEPQLGEPLPPALVQWAAGQPSLETAVDGCERADWVVWLLANNASTDDEKRHAIRAGCAGARLAELAGRYPTMGHVLQPFYTRFELAQRWASPSQHDDATPISDSWLPDFFSAILLAGAVASGVAYVVWRRGWSTTDWQLAFDVVLIALTPAFHFLWRHLRRALNRGRERRFSFEDGWRLVRPYLTPAWERSAASQSLFLYLSKPRREARE